MAREYAEQPFDPEEQGAPEEKGGFGEWGSAGDTAALWRELESPTQRVLRVGFQDVTAENQIGLNSFDPDDPGGEYTIALTTVIPEADEAEPQLAAVLQAGMLRRLGLGVETLPAGHVDRLIACTDENGVEQMRMVTRGTDGKRLPVYTWVRRDAAGGQTQTIRLLSYDRAAQEVARMEARLPDGDKVRRRREVLDDRLREAFDLDDASDGLLNKLTPAEKRSMLAEVQGIRGLAEDSQDEAVLDRLRHKLVSAMLPANKLFILRERRHRKADEAYRKAVKGLIKRYSVGEESAQVLLEDERQRRLAALDEQLHRRQRAAKVGMVAVAVAAPMVAAAVGAVAGVTAESTRGTMTEFPVETGAISAAAMGALGAAFVAWNGVQLHRRIRRMQNFAADALADDGKLKQQLAAERQLADDYIEQLAVWGRKSSAGMPDRQTTPRYKS